jgi:type I restriction enzyme S subunit
MRHRWPLVPLGEVLRQVVDSHPVRADQSYPNFGIYSFGRGLFAKPPISGASTSATTLLRARKDHFIYSRLFAFEGAYGLVPEEFDGWFVSNEYPMFECDKSRIVPAYLAIYFKRPSVWNDVAQLSTGMGHRRRRIQPRHFLTHNLPLPPLDEQRRLVARIDELVGKIREAQALGEKARSERGLLISGLIDSVFRDAVARYGGYLLGDACLLITDGDHLTPTFSDEGVKFIFVGNVSSRYLHFIGCKFVDESYYQALSPSRKPKRGDVLYTAVGATLGVPALVDTDEPFCFQRHVALIRPDTSKTEPRYLWHLLQSRTVFDRAWSTTTGSAQPTIPLKAIRDLPMPLPPIAEQRRFVDYLDQLQGRLGALAEVQSRTHREIQDLFPAILDQAFRGDL